MKPVVSLELLLCGLTAASHIPRTACKAHPDDGLHWPSQESWASLNHTLGGNLLQPPPPGGVCHPGQSNYEAGQCATVAKEWLTYDFHSRNPISVMSNQFANDTCLPREDSPCSAAGYPAYVIDASTPEHVKQGVDFARRHNVRLVVRSSGHDYLGRSTAPGALSLWVHHLDEIEHHSGEFQLAGSKRILKGSAITVGGGVTLESIYEATDKFGETIVGGLARTVSVGGYITGGGHSALSPRYGLAADNVLQMEVVTASGETLTVNQDQHQDLFWALRGGGGSTFGVITSMTMKTHPTPKIVQAGLVVTTQLNDTILPDLMGYIASQVPYILNSGVSGYSYIGHNMTSPLPPGSGLPSAIPGLIGTFIVQDKSLDAVHAIFKPLNDTIMQRWQGDAKMLVSTKEYPSFLAWIRENYDEDPTGQDLFLASRLLDTAFVQGDERTIGQTLWDVSGKLSRLAMFVLGGRGVQEAKPAGGSDSVNPAWRRALVHACGIHLFKPLDETAYHNAVDELNAAIQPLRDMTPQSGSYVNEALPEEPHWQQAFWGGNYNRLARIKRQVDPHDVFWCTPCVGNERWKQRHDGRLCMV